MAGQPKKATLLIWKIFKWFARPYVRQVGVRRHASRVLDLVDAWPGAESRLREILRTWALGHSPVTQLLGRYPWSPSCWHYALNCGYQRVRRTVTSTGRAAEQRASSVRRG